MPHFPARVRSGPSTFLERCPDLYAVRRESTKTSEDAIAVVSDDAATAYEVHEGQPGRVRDAGPVYSAGAGGPIAIPTGRVFVRLAAGVRPEQRQDALAAAGFEIERTMSYAPNAAWLRPIEGSIASALAGLGALERLPDVEHVEPQLLMQRAFKAR